MPKLQKYIHKENLAQYQTWVVDTDPLSKYFRISQLPEVLTGGKNAFLINGSEFLIGTTEVKIEIIDSEGNPIFVQPIRNYVEGLARVVSIEVYESTAPGPATITIMGQLRTDERGNIPPDQFVNAYNVKWSTSVNVVPFRPNSSPIRLYQSPVLRVGEVLTNFRYPISSGPVTVSTGSVQFVNQSPTIISTGFEFNRYMVNAPFYATIEGNPFTSSIERVVSANVARLSSVPTSSTEQLLINPVPSAFSIRYEGPVQFGISEFTRSFADINLSKLTTFSGDIARAKIYVRSIDQSSNYQQVTDVLLESLNLTATHSLHTGEQNVSVGSIVSQSIIDRYWDGGQIVGRGYVSGGVVLSYDSASLLDSITIASPSTIVPDYDRPNYFMRLTKPLEFFEALEYTFRANFTCKNDFGQYPARMDVYLFGEAFPSSSNDPYGVRLASYQLPTGISYRAIEDVSINFLAPRDGTSQLTFIVYSGDWYASDVSIKSARETGFNPDEINILTAIEGRRYERLQFKAELFDPNSNYVPMDIFSDVVFFDGGNSFFRGEDARLDGILTISPSGSGPTLTSKGFNDRSGNYTLGQAIAIGPPIPFVRNKNTAFFAGTSSTGPEISVGDKMYGYYDQTIDQFVLEIDGVIRIGSGSNYIDIRSLLPNNPSFRISQFLSGSALDFYDVRGRNSVSAGRWNDQIGRMGYYTRGYTGFVSESTLTLSQLTAQFNPYQFPTQSVTLFSSGSITIPSDHLFFNETLYTSASFQVSQLNVNPSLTYRMNYTVDVLTSWTGYPSPSLSGQILLSDTTYYVVSSGSFPPITVSDYPIFIPRDRVGNTLYVLLRLNAVTYPTT